VQSTTLAVAILGSILVLSLHSRYALAAYIGTLLWYPEYLRVSISTIDISVGRIVVTVLLLRYLCDKRIMGKFVWSRLDTWVALNMAVYVGMYCATHPFGAAVENQGGFVMDTWFAYMAARLTMTDKRTLVYFIKTISIILVPLAMLGVFESITHWQPFYPSQRFSISQPLAGEMGDYRRWGFAQAVGPLGHFIMFGACFVMFLPLIWSLRREPGHWKQLAYPLSAMACIGAISSFASCSWVMLFTMIFCLVMERYRHWIRKMAILLLLLLMLTKLTSNRPLYHVLADYGNLTGGSWWDRVALIDSAIADFGKWWLTGYGGKDPGWGAAVWAEHTDVNNQFILIGVNCGILGIIALCGVLLVAFRCLSDSYKKTNDHQLKSIYWALGSVLVSTIVVWQGVSFFGQMPSIFYTVLGIIGSSVGFAKYVNPNGYRVVKTHNGPVLALQQIRTI